MIPVSIEGEDWIVDGRITHPGRSYDGHRVEGLLLNTRMANGVFDDLNPLTAGLWAYPDTGRWDPERNTDELIAMLPTYRSHGLDAICLNLQGAAPSGYYRSHEQNVNEIVARVRRDHPDATVDEIWADLDGVVSQPWKSGGFERDGSLIRAFMTRTERVLRAAEDNGLVVVLGLFYFGQDERLRDEQAVRTAVVNACEWLLVREFPNVVVEINNETDVPRYEHPVLCPPRVHELIELAASVRASDGRRLLVGTSFAREMLPTEAVVGASDFVLLHGNGIDDPAALAERVDATRATSTYRGQPILFNEDDHFDFDQPMNNFIAALSRHAGWGYFDPGPGAGGSAAYGDYDTGFQNPPINWELSTARKRGFFELLAKVAGADTAA